MLTIFLVSTAIYIAISTVFAAALGRFLGRNERRAVRALSEAGKPRAPQRRRAA
jgi:hypothetical protein